MEGLQDEARICIFRVKDFTMQKFTLRQRLHYRFENTLATGTGAVIAWLAVLSLLIILLAATLIHVFDIPAAPDEPTSWGFWEGLWNSLMRTLDAGNMADDAGWMLRIVTLFVTIGGIFIVATLIGSIGAGFEGAIEELRKGKSIVIESGHTVILGWSPKIFRVISELVVANANQRRPRIVVMADKDKVDMEDEIRQKVSDTGNTRIICRTGSPIDMDDLRLISMNEAKSIIILSPEDSAFPDTWTIKSILAITNNPERRKEPFHIVAELRDTRNLEAAELVGGDELCVLPAPDIISKVTAQTCRQSGLSVLYSELLDFERSEIYMSEEASLVGKTYRHIISAYNDSTVMGIRKADGRTLINPPMDHLFQEGDKVIAITQDDDTLIPDKEPAAASDASLIVGQHEKITRPEKTLLMGWNEKGVSIIRELDNYVAAGSSLLVICDHEVPEAERTELAAQVEHTSLEWRQADITTRRVIEAARPDLFDHIILLCDPDMPVQEADARILIALLHLRNYAELNQKDLSIVSEMRDVRNRSLAEVAKADDFIVSDNMVALLIAQISENRDLAQVFDTLFSDQGSEVYIRPIGQYVKTDVDMDFHTLLEAAARKGETAIGYRLLRYSEDAGKAYGIVSNPVKSERVSFAPEDRIIVLAED